MVNELHRAGLDHDALDPPFHCLGKIAGLPFEIAQSPAESPFCFAFRQTIEESTPRLISALLFAVKECEPNVREKRVGSLVSQRLSKAQAFLDSSRITGFGNRIGFGRIQ